MKYLIIYIIILLILFYPNIINIPYKKCKYQHIESFNIKNFESNNTFSKIFNPSIVWNNNNIIICARESNNSLKTIFNWLVHKFILNTYSNIIIQDGNKNIFFEDKLLEDPRIIKFKNYYLISVVKYSSPKNIFPLLIILNKKFQIINKLKYIFSEKRNKIEKNWCLFIHENEIYLHTDTYPKWIIYKLIFQKNYVFCLKFKEYSLDLNIKYFLRCSTSWKEFNKEYYIVGLHSKIFFVPFCDIKSLLVLVDKKTFKPLYITNQLCLCYNSHERIQFLSGLEVDNEYVYLSFGVGDYKYEIHKVNKKIILKHLIEIK